jgi:hypothetical protein
MDRLPIALPANSPRDKAFRNLCCMILAQGVTSLSENNQPDLTEDPNSKRLPTLESATSSVVQFISIIVRKNNLNYFGPYLLSRFGFESTTSALVVLKTGVLGLEISALLLMQPLSSESRSTLNSAAQCRPFVVNELI